MQGNNMGIRDPTEMETFANESKLAKLLQELKWTPRVAQQKRFAGFYRMSVIANLWCFRRFAAG